jgi:hypothetical protein
MPARLRVNDPNQRDDPLILRGDASELRRYVAGAQPPANSLEPQVDGPPAATRTVPGAVGQADSVVINVIVAYTKKAARHYGDVDRELVALSIEEANQSFRNSKVGQIRLALVHTYQTDYEEEGMHFEHLWRFADKGDGYLEEIHALREKHDADVAILIVDDPTGCGLSTRVYANADEAFAVVHHQCAVVSYTVSVT